MPPTPTYVRMHSPGLKREIVVQSSQVPALLKHGHTVVDEGEVLTDPDRPKDSASKADWVGYGETKGGERESLEGMTRAELIAAYGG